MFRLSRLARSGVAATALTLVSCVVAAQGSYEVFGKGCPGDRGVPRLTGVGDHKIGGNTTVQILNLAPNQAGVLLFGLSNTVWSGSQKLPVDLGVIGMPGCKLLVSNDSFRSLNTGNGFISSTFKHPLQKSLIGKSLFNQFAALDPSAKTPVKTVLSNAAKLMIGPACRDGAKKVDADSVNVKIPPIPKLNTPTITLTASYSGTRQTKCCVGPLNPRHGCSFSGSGKAAGNAGKFLVPVPPEIAKKLSDELCAEVRSKTGGIVTCELTWKTLEVPGATFSGALSASKNDCTSKFAWNGSGKIAFGQVKTTVRARFWIKILFKIRYTTDIDIIATPSGSWAIASNKISASGRIPWIRAQKEFKVLGIPIKIRKTFDTPQISGTTKEVALPSPPVVCK